MTVGAVASGHRLTTEAATEILRDGGNAFDAAIAGLWMACIAEPVLASPGGGGFLLAHSPKDATPNRLFDFFTDTPLQRLHDQDTLTPIHADFGTATQEFHIGPGSIATPGFIAGLYAVHDRLGSIPMSRLMEPAIHAAEKGVTITPFQAYLFSVVSPIFLSTDSSRALFAEGSPARIKAEGESYRLPQLAQFMEQLGREGADFFYRGEGGNGLIDLCRREGGHLTRDDLNRYRVDIRQPLSCLYRGHRIITNPPPSTGGTLIAFALSLLDSASSEAPTQSRDAFFQTMNTVQATVNEVRRKLEQGESSGLHTLLDPAHRDEALATFAHHRKSYRGTTHISVVDAEGNAASTTVSNGEGCGAVLPDAGFMPNNMLGEEDINPQGIGNWSAGQRMSSMMSPSLIQHRDGTLTALGSGGSNRIRSAILQVVINLLEGDHDLQQAVCAPRLHRENQVLNVENPDNDPLPIFSPPSEDLVLWDELNMFFGGVHAVQLNPDGGLHAQGDPRRDGHATLAYL